MKKRILSILVLMTLVLGIMPEFRQTEAVADEALGFMTTEPGKNSAYCNFYGDRDSRFMSFIDKGESPYAVTTVTKDGYDGVAPNGSSYIYFKIDESFYDPGDNEFLVNVVFYDPNVKGSRLYIDHFDSANRQVPLQPGKSSTENGWQCVSAVIDDMTMNSNYPEGSVFRLTRVQEIIYRRIEIINLSRLKRNNEKLDIGALGALYRYDLVSTGIFAEHENVFKPTQNVKACTKADVVRLFEYINMGAIKSESLGADDEITQRELLLTYMDTFGLNYGSTDNVVQFALDSGLIDSSGLFFRDDDIATNYNLGYLIRKSLYIPNEAGTTRIWKMYENGFFGDKHAMNINNETLKKNYLSEPRKLPSKTVTDESTGRTFKYINFYGSDLNAGYFVMNQWLPDGKRFLCGDSSNNLYIYNIETEILTYVATTYSSQTNRCLAVVGPDGMIYYFELNPDWSRTLVRVDPDDPTFTPEDAYNLPVGVLHVELLMGTDGKEIWFGGGIADNNNVFKTPKGYRPVVTFTLPEKSVRGVTDMNHTVQYVKDEERATMQHPWPNPVYKDISFYSMDVLTANYEQAHITNRANIMNMNTGEVVTLNQGRIKNDQHWNLFTHEVFSACGNYLYVQVLDSAGNNTVDNYSFLGQPIMPNGGAGLMRVNLDGTHRTYWELSANHPGVNADGTWAIGSGSGVMIMNMQTHQGFRIAEVNRNMVGSISVTDNGTIHPTQNLIMWNYYEGKVKGIAWYDFTEIAENEIAEGGRYKLNDYVETVSYKGLDCDSEIVEMKGRTCQAVSAGKKIFYAINTDIADTTDDKIRITFDYLDNDMNPIIITYTSGVKHINDAPLRMNKQIKQRRNASGKWKTAVIDIPSANCESIGKYETDFTINGGSAKTYISNVKVERIEK